MTHPETLLAGYVDGTLPDDERAVVDAHLAGCATCREEVELARSAVTALAALPEEPVPFGVMGPVMKESGKRFERRAAFGQRVQWAAGIAAAVALVVAVGVNLTGPDDPRSPAALEADAGGGATGAAESAPMQAVDVALERQRGVNYTSTGVDGLAMQSASRSSGTAASLVEDAGAPETGEGDGEDQGGGGGDDALAFSAVTQDALDCLRGAEVPVDDPRDRLIRLIEAEFERTPAYLAVLLEGPGAGQEPTKAVVWVVAKQGCVLLHAAQDTI
jgi:predicted anti-sigma-YlaC factor YlaD